MTTGPTVKAVLLAGALALGSAPAAYAKAGGEGAKGIKSKCTVAGVVWDTVATIFGSTKCSIFNSKPAASSTGSKAQGNPKGGDKGKAG